MESKNTELKETESRRKLAKGLGGGGNGRCWSEGTNFQIKMSKFQGSKVVTIVDNTVLYS